MLHSAAQKQVHNFNADPCAEEIPHAEKCLGILSSCAGTEKVARRFWQQLNALYSSVISNQQRISPTTVSPLVRTMSSSFTLDGQDNSCYLLSVPAMADPERRDLSLRIISLLCRPLREGPLEDLEDVVKTRQARDLRRHDQEAFIELLDWDTESPIPSAQTLHGLGAGPMIINDPTPQHSPNHATFFETA